MKKNDRKLYDYTKAQKLKIKERDGDKCFLCDSKEKLTVAHVFVPKFKGARPILENAICLCEKCHKKMDRQEECTRQEQIRMLRLCQIYLTFYYMKEIKDVDIKTYPRKKVIRCKNQINKT